MTKLNNSKQEARSLTLPAPPSLAPSSSSSSLGQRPGGTSDYQTTTATGGPLQRDSNHHPEDDGPVDRVYVSTDSTYLAADTSSSIMTATSYKNPWCSCCIRMLLILVLALAIISSAVAAMSCQFFTIKDFNKEDEQWFSTLFPQPDSAQDTSVTIGLFSHGSMRPGDESNSSWITHNFLDLSQCTPYGDNTRQSRFWTVTDHGTFFVTAQWASLIAPFLGAVAWVYHLCSTIRWVYQLGHQKKAPLKHYHDNHDQIHSFRRRFVFLVILHLLATLLQGYTFAMYADLDFCLGVDDLNCELGYAGYASIAAIMLYYASLVLLCFLPRPDDGLLVNSSSQKANRDLTNSSHPSHPGASPPISPSNDSRSVHFEERMDPQHNLGRPQPQLHPQRQPPSEPPSAIFRLPGNLNIPARTIYSNDSSSLSYLSSDHDPIVLRSGEIGSSREPPPESISEEEA